MFFLWLVGLHGLANCSEVGLVLLDELGYLVSYLQT